MHFRKMHFSKIPLGSVTDGSGNFVSIDGTPGIVGDPHGTVVAMAPENPMPFWPAPPKGDTVIAPPPTGPDATP